MSTDRSRTVVVGVDGSRASLAALTAALTEADRRHRTVEVVTVWAPPTVVSGRGGGLLFPTRAARRRALRVQTLATAMATRLAGVRVPVSGVLLEGDPAEILVRASAGASELVLGAPRSGAPDRATIPSVARRCLSEAACPVRVVPVPARGSVGAYAEAAEATEHEHGEEPSRAGP